MIKSKDDVLEKLDKVYEEQNPSLFVKNLKNKKKLFKLIENRKKFLFNLNLPPKLFEGTNLLDLGCGSGQNSLAFNYLKSNCTLVEYNFSSFINAKNLFKKYAISKYKIINQNLFQYKSKKKFDFVVSNGVAHHTFNPEKNIDLACKFLKKSGFLILGVCTPEGWFQRNLQRIILFNISENQREILKNAKFLFTNHLNRSVKFGLRTKEQVIYDTYINPKINCVPYKDIVKIFKKNKITIYSSLNYSKNLEEFLSPNYDQQKQSEIKNKDFNDNNINISPLHEFSSSNYQFSEKKLKNNAKDILYQLSKVSNQVNDVTENKKIKLHLNYIENLEKKIKKGLIVNLLDYNYNKQFLLEVKKIYQLISKKKSKSIKIKIFKKIIDSNKVLFKGTCGIGMNYFVGYKE